MDEISFHGVAEAVNNGRGDDERHEKIEIIVERDGWFGDGFREWSRDDVYRL
jgi:hypothetical protein